MVDKEYLPFVKLLKDKDAKVRLKATVDLGEKGGAAASTATALCDAIMDTSPRVGEAALVALEKVRPDLYAHVSRMILDKDRPKQFQAIAGLGLLGEKALPTKNLLLARLRMETVKMMPIVPYSAERHDAAVVALLSSIRQIDDENTECHKVEKVLASVTNKDPQSRLDAIDRLIQWAGDAEVRRKEILPLIGNLLSDNALLVAGIDRLASYGNLSKGYLPTLKKLKLAPAEVVRIAANKAVDAIEGK